MEIYKVKVQILHIDCRIEGFTCDVYMFKDLQKALQFAYYLAKKHSNLEKQFPIEQQNETELNT
jgi:hypothetical protein